MQTTNSMKFGLWRVATLALFALTVGCAKSEDSPRPIASSAPEVVGGDPATTTWNGTTDGRILDEKGQPASGASIVVDGVEYVTGLDGRFRVPVTNSNQNVLVRKAGYQKIVVKPQAGPFELQLKPLIIRGVYVQAYNVRRNDGLMQGILKLIESTELNALVIDVKDDDGRVQRDLAPFAAKLKAKGVYLIARIVTFKDNTITRQRPELSIMGLNGEPWQDRHGVRYLNPFDSDAHDYLISVAKEAVNMGFDEVQFDYVRFPTDGNLSMIRWPQKVDWKTRSTAIATLLKRARSELGAMGAFIAADVFGITGHEPRDSGIGQHLETITPYLDFVCPMVYPAGYAQGTSGIANPSNSPGAIVGDSVKRYRVRTQASVVVRPWLQAFKDYNSWSGRFYGAEEISAQINASNQAGASGFLLWNAQARYTSAGLNPKKGGVDVGSPL